MEKFEAKLRGCNALALHMATLGLQHILGGIPIWSNIDVMIDDALSDDDTMVVHLHGKRVHVPGTRHLYKPAVQVTLTKTHGGHWKFRSMTIFLHHHRMDEYIADHSVDISLEPGIENITDFSSLQSEVENPRLTYSVCLPALTTHFAIPE